MGSFNYALLVGYAWLTSHFITIIIDSALEVNTCAIGFSAVLFCLKYIWNSSPSSHGYTSIMGIAVTTRYAAWLELVIIQLLTPNASFTGHLGGILAGVLYIHIIEPYLIKQYRGQNRNTGTERSNDWGSGYAR